MTETELRVKFERWALSKGFSTFRKDMGTGPYISPVVEIAWQAVRGVFA